MMLVYRGRVIFEYGDIKRVSKIASVRKSIPAMLYGNYVASGKADFNKSVEEPGLNDIQPFLPIGKGANLGYLLTARSGIYHPSGECGIGGFVVSARGGSARNPFSVSEFGTLTGGTAFEKISGKDIFVALETELAVPLGM